MDQGATLADLGVRFVPKRTRYFFLPLPHFRHRGTRGAARSRIGLARKRSPRKGLEDVRLTVPQLRALIIQFDACEEANAWTEKTGRILVVSVESVINAPEERCVIGYFVGPG
jgi:hypothetical protein